MTCRYPDTDQQKPFVELEWLDLGLHINAIGADAEGKQEFESNLGDKCHICVVDDKAQAFHSGESQHTENKERFINLDQVVRFGFERPDSSISLFDSTGLATEDVAVANYIYNQINS